jgi:N-carbamoyl-L-amino-acid hydrolase
MSDGQPRGDTSGSVPALEFGAKILDMARELAQFSETTEGLTCTYFSPAHKATAGRLRDWMRSAGLAAEIDAIGNVVGRYAGAAKASRNLIVGSHYDTVTDAGQFDGCLGILTAIVVAEHLHCTGRRLPFHLEVLIEVWIDETERRTWFLFEATRRSNEPARRRETAG